MREGDVILIADMCHNGSEPKYITHRAKGLPDDAGIKVSDSGHTFKVNVQKCLLLRPSRAAEYCE